jgi:hypothetical protein
MIVPTYGGKVIYSGGKVWLGFNCCCNEASNTCIDITANSTCATSLTFTYTSGPDVGGTGSWGPGDTTATATATAGTPCAGGFTGIQTPVSNVNALIHGGALDGMTFNMQWQVTVCCIHGALSATVNAGVSGRSPALPVPSSFPNFSVTVSPSLVQVGGKLTGTIIFNFTWAEGSGTFTAVLS